MKDKTLSIKEYLNIITPYLSNKINDQKTQSKWEVYSSKTVIDYKTQGEWTIQLTKTINFISSKDFREDRIIHSKVKSDSIKIMIGNETDEIIRELFESLLQRYQKDLEDKMKESEFVFGRVCVINFIK